MTKSNAKLAVISFPILVVTSWILYRRSKE